MNTNFMGLLLPYVGGSTTYVTDINSNYTIIDLHDHVNSGAPICQNSISWDVLNLTGNYISTVSYLSLNNLSNSSGTPNSSMIFVDGELFWVDGAANVIQLTKSGYVNIENSYNGFYGNFTLYNAAVYFDNTSNSYTFSATTAPPNSEDAYTQICFSTVTAETVSSIYSLIISESIYLSAQYRMYTDAYFPGVFSDTFPTFYVDSNGNFQSNSISSESYQNTFLSGLELNYVDALYMKSSVFTLPPTGVTQILLVATTGTIEAYETGTTLGPSCCVTPFLNIYSTAISSFPGYSVSSLATPIIYRALIKPSDTSPEYLTYYPNDPTYNSNDKYISVYIPLPEGSSEYLTFVFAWEYEIITASDQNGGLNISATTVAECFVNGPGTSSQETSTSFMGYLQLQGYNEALGTDVDFFVMLTLHIIFLVAD